MPRPPAKKHVLADIRLRCDLTQPELARILDVAAVTVQRIEQGTLDLSQALAQKAQEQLDVSAVYLLANDPKQEPVTARGGRWTKDLFEFVQGARSIAREEKPSKERLPSRYRYGAPPIDGATDEFVAWKVADLSSKIHGMLEATKGTPKQGILVHRLNTAINKLLEDFEPDKAVLEKHGPRLKKLRSAYDKTAQRIANEEHNRIWREEQKL